LRCLGVRVCGAAGGLGLVVGGHFGDFWGEGRGSCGLWVVESLVG
jgi:hypothetical protein